MIRDELVQLPAPFACGGKRPHRIKRKPRLRFKVLDQGIDFAGVQPLAISPVDHFKSGILEVLAAPGQRRQLQKILPPVVQRCDPTCSRTPQELIPRAVANPLEFAIQPTLRVAIDFNFLSPFLFYGRSPFPGSGLVVLFTSRSCSIRACGHPARAS